MPRPLKTTPKLEARRCTNGRREAGFHGNLMFQGILLLLLGTSVTHNSPVIGAYAWLAAGCAH